MTVLLKSFKRLVCRVVLYLNNYTYLPNSKMNEIVCVKDIEKHAFKVLPKNALDYYRSGAGSEETLGNNRTAFSKIRIRPKCMRNVAKRDMSTFVLGDNISMPIGISPTAMQRMAHSEGECANARAAQAMGTIFILSTLSNSSIEEVAEAAPHAVKWFQLYIYNDREITKSLVRRAEKAGFKALVLTVDAPIFGIRLADVRNNFALPPHLKLANFEGLKATGVKSADDKGSGISDYVNKLFDATLEWKDIKWLQSITTLPIVLKGILTAQDAIKGADLGIAAIVVSNHGARQIDGVPAAIEALPEIVQAVGHRIEVYVDGGIREGTDVFRALALGARMTFIGRPAVWGLAYNGEEGVKKVLGMLKFELDNTLALTGCTSIEDITSDMVVHENYYAHL